MSSQLHNALELESQQDTRRQSTRFAQARRPQQSGLESQQGAVSVQSLRSAVSDQQSRRNDRRTGTRGSHGRGLWIDGRRVSALEWQASQYLEWQPAFEWRRGSHRRGLGGFQKWPGRNLQFGFQGPARVAAWSRVAVSLLGTYTVVDVEDYLTGPDATTVSWEFEELDLVLLPSSDPVH